MTCKSIKYTLVVHVLADRPLGPLGLGSGPLGPRVKYTLVVMMILTFGQLHFVIS
jgi:hypothetical protein